MHWKVVVNLLESENNEVKNFQNSIDPLLELAIDDFELKLAKHNRTE